MPQADSSPIAALSSEALHSTCDPAQLGFDTTAELPALGGMVGQADALAALEFGVTINAHGYNIFVLGEPGSGRMSIVRQALEARARTLPAPDDWCYVANFADARRPRALRVPRGRGRALATDVALLISELRQRIPPAMEAEAVAAQRLSLVEEQEKAATGVLDQLQADLAPDPFVALVGAPDALMVVAAREHEPLERAAYNALTPEQRAEVDEHVQAARHASLAAHRRLHEIAQEARERVAELNLQVGRGIVEQLVAMVRERYAGLEASDYLTALANDVLQNLDAFLPQEEVDGAARALAEHARDAFFRRYAVHLVLGNDLGAHAPVVHESNPTYANLVGRVERQLEMGVLRSDFTQIVPGALHRANGGFLLLDAGDLLSRPLAWPALKRALQMRHVTPTDLAADLGAVGTETLDPQPIALDVKVVLVGEPHVYYMLRNADHEFAELFKVKSDFAPDVERTPESERAYADFVASWCADNVLPPFVAPAVARIVEEGSRAAGDQRRLTTRMRAIADVLTEAAHYARAGGRTTVGLQEVERALVERDRRDRRPQRDLLEMIRRGVLRFEPRGEAVGQVFGIGLLSLGELSFGRPIRVAASAFMGTGGVVNLEREVSLSGPIHTKGFLIISGYLGALFARTQPLVFSGTLSFEQMYEELEGDSASAAELFALISAIARVPLRQGIGVTGAVNQEGVILPVGGVTDKVEGFFEACRVVGLTGEQGVILPRRNADNLVLRQEVRDAVAQGRFRIWTIDRIEEGWPILSGREAGAELAPGEFPPGTVNHAVMQQLAAWAAAWKRLDERPAVATPS